MNHPEPLTCDSAADLLGVYALDALDADEANLVRDHLQRCPRCSQEVDQHRESIVMLAGGGGPAPERLWDRIASSIGADAGPSSAPPPPRLATAARRRQNRVKPIWAGAVAVAAALTAVVGLQTVRVDQLNHRVNQLATAARQTGGFQGLAAALVDPSARHYTLTSTSPARQPLGQLIILPSGSSYLVGSRLPQLTSDSTYQLWSMLNGRAVSVGLLGAHPDTAAFTVDPSVPTAAYLVTVEPAGGVVAPTSSPIAQAAT